MVFALRLPAALVLAGTLSLAVAAAAQSTTQPASSSTQSAPASPVPATQAPAASDAAPVHGQVLFQSHGAPPQAPDPNADIDRAGDGSVANGTMPAQAHAGEPAAGTPADISDDVRSAITITGYDLDARLLPARSRLTMRALLTIRNDSTQPLPRLALQVSSSLRWESVTMIGNGAPASLPLVQHLIETDADHTGKANEAILLLPRPLAPGASVRLDAFYAGTIAQDGSRLARIGADATQAADADWDQIGLHAGGASNIALRGFGNVLWYPVSSPQYFLGQGNELFEAIGRMRLREAAAEVHLRLAIEFQGEPPTAVYFCGRRSDLHTISDNADAPVATNEGWATAEFAAEPLGYRAMSLFVLNGKEDIVASVQGEGWKPEAATVAAEPAFSSSTGASQTAAPAKPPPSLDTSGAPEASPGGAPVLAVATDSTVVPSQLTGAAQPIVPVLAVWFGQHPPSAVTLIDHPGQAYEDGPLVVAPAAALASPEQSSALAYSLAHAWVQTGQPWIDEGLSGFASLVVSESQHGRDAALSELSELLRPLQIAEPGFDSETAENAPGAPQGQPLIAATSEVYYRRKAAAVFWMLRSVLGDAALGEAIRTLVAEPPSRATATEQALALEKLLEKTSGKDLGWLFNDWVLHDRGLPDLSFVDVTPRALPTGPGHDSGWLVAVTMRNDGGATADVPVVVRSGAVSSMQRMRIAPFSEAVARILMAEAPTEVIVNDGSMPEVRTPQHVRTIVLR
jgi:hypothetical protein